MRMSCVPRVLLGGFRRYTEAFLGNLLLCWCSRQDGRWRFISFNSRMSGPLLPLASLMLVSLWIVLCFSLCLCRPVSSGILSCILWVLTSSFLRVYLNLFRFNSKPPWASTAKGKLCYGIILPVLGILSSVVCHELLRHMSKDVLLISASLGPTVVRGS